MNTDAEDEEPIFICVHLRSSVVKKFSILKPYGSSQATGLRGLKEEIVRSFSQASRSSGLTVSGRWTVRIA